jgi:hypothetical protein
LLCRQLNRCRVVFRHISQIMILFRLVFVQ